MVMDGATHPPSTPQPQPQPLGIVGELVVWYGLFVVAALALRWGWPRVGLVLALAAVLLVFLHAPHHLPTEVLVVYAFASITQLLRVWDLFVAALTWKGDAHLSQQESASQHRLPCASCGDTSQADTHDHAGLRHRLGRQMRQREEKEEKAGGEKESEEEEEEVEQEEQEEQEQEQEQGEAENTGRQAQQDKRGQQKSALHGGSSSSSSSSLVSSTGATISTTHAQLPPYRQRRHKVLFSEGSCFAVLYVQAYHDVTLGRRERTRLGALRLAWQDAWPGCAIHLTTAAVLALLAGMPRLTVEQARRSHHPPHDEDGTILATEEVQEWHVRSESELLPTFFSFSGLFDSAETAAVAQHILDTTLGLLLHALVVLHGLTGLCGVDLLWRSIYSIGGISCRSTLDAPQLWRARTVRGFWRAWNREMQHLLHLALYWPVKHRLGATGAGVTTFLASALLHAVPFVVAGATPRHLLMIAAFFVLQPCLILLERVFHLSGKLWAHGAFLFSSVLITQPFIEFALPHLAHLPLLANVV